MANEKTLLDEFAKEALSALLVTPWSFSDLCLELHDGKSIAENYAINAYEMAEAMMAEKKKREEANAPKKTWGGWTPWNGGCNPAAGKILIVRSRNGAEELGISSAFKWEHNFDPKFVLHEIIAYKILDEVQP